MSITVSYGNDPVSFSSGASLTCVDALRLLTPHVGTALSDLPGVSCAGRANNKGRHGLCVEEFLGIAPNSHCLDLADGEIKTIEVRKDRLGRVRAKQPLAVSMLGGEQLDLLLGARYEQMRAYRKMRQVVMVLHIGGVLVDAFLLNENTSRVVRSHLRQFSALRDATVAKLDAGGRFGTTTVDGIQARTKGPGRSSSGTHSAVYNRKVSDRTYAIYVTARGVNAYLDERSGVSSPVPTC